MNFTAKLATGLLLASVAPYFAPAMAQQVPIKQGPVKKNPNLPRSLLGENVQNQWVQCAVSATYAWWNPACSARFPPTKQNGRLAQWALEF